MNRIIFHLISPLSIGYYLKLSHDFPDIIKLIYLDNRSRPSFGHTLLRFHTLKLTLNDSPQCTLRNIPAICDILHILFDCPSLDYKRKQYFTLSNFFHTQPNLIQIITSKRHTIINSTITFLNYSGFII